MTHPAWNDLCKQPTLGSYCSEKYAKIVYDSTQQLHQPVQSILSALNLRAMGLAKCAHFDSALCDANAMQQLAPSSALGYLCAANIYSEQGKQLQVIRICSKGLNMVDAMDTCYDTLQQTKEDAEQRQSTRIDFMSQLPIDIVITILIPMIMNNSPLSSLIPCPYLHVSNLWRDRFIQSLDGLRFEVDYNEDHNLSHVVELSRYIKALDVRPYSHATWLEAFLGNHDFSSLRVLRIREYFAECVDPLVSSLIPIGSNLTHLYAALSFTSVVSIADVMHSCPNLVLLDIFQQRIPDLISLQSTTWPKLTTLSLTCVGGAHFKSNDIRAIGESFPSLKKLSFYPNDYTFATGVVLNYYPWMKRLKILSDGFGDELVYVDQGLPCEEIGITSIYIETAESPEDFWTFLIYELREHRKTLARIECDIFPDDEEKDAIYAIEYIRLKQLYLIGSGWWIPRKAPMLEELKMTADAISGNMAVLDTIPPNLKKLELALDEELDVHNKAGIERYLQRFARHTQLKELIMHICDLHHFENVLIATHHLWQLQRLMITSTHKWDYDSMQRFIDGLVKGCPNLACLELKCTSAPSTYFMKALKQLPRLEQVAFSIESIGGDDDFWNAVQGTPQLKGIRIYPANAANMDAIRGLQQQRLDLKIILDQTFTRF